MSSRFPGPEGQPAGEPEPNLPKTGLELIEKAVGENPTRWIKIEKSHNMGDLELVMVGDNGIRGRFSRGSFLSFLYDDEPGKRFLEKLGAVKTEAHHGIHWDPHYPIDVARHLKELRGKEVVLLVFIKVEDYPIGETWGLYEVPVKNIEGLITKADKGGDRYWLSAGLLTLEFSARKGKFVNEGYTAPLGEIKIGEAVSQIESALEESRRLEEFLVANRGLFK